MRPDSRKAEKSEAGAGNPTLPGVGRREDERDGGREGGREGGRGGAQGGG